MGATYTRQSSSAIVDGGVIEASDLNAEFNQILAAFEVSTGHTHDGTAGEGGPVTKLLGSSITIGDGTAGNNIAVTFDGETGDGVLTWMEDEDYFQFSDDILISSTEKLQFRDTAIYINSSADGQLDLVADTEIQIAATTIDINGAVDISGALTLAGTTLAETIADTVGAMVSSNTETGITVTYDDSDNTLDFVLGAAQTTITSLLATDIKIGEDNETKIDFETANEIHFYAANTEQVYLGDNIFGPQSDSDVDLGSTGVRWKDAFIDSITTTGNVTVGGDLTVSGDDITMGTNTDGNLLVADGTNFNSIAVSSLSEISTAASDDVFLAIDTSGGGLKKIQRSAVVAGLATDSAISNVVDDTSPQLGGNLDTNSQNILIDDAHFIADESGNEQIIFQTTGSAVNQFDVTNAASGSGPQLSATGSDSNIDLNILAKGTGHVTVVGNTNAGAIQFNCESNSHGQILKSQPHSASVTNVMLLPAGADSTLVSLVSTDILTNKTLTSPVINTGTFGTSILPTSADGTTLGSASKEFSDLFLADAGTIQFGNDQEVTLTHVADTGVLLNGANVIQLRDSAINIGSPADGDLDINADDEIELNSTLIDINGNVEISGTATTTGVHTFTAVPVFPNNTIETADIQADAVDGTKIADDAINSEHYTDGSIDTAHIADNQITLAKLAGGTDGNIISFDASGDPVAIATGSDGQVLTSTGAGSPPAFEALPAAGISAGKSIAFAIVFG